MRFWLALAFRIVSFLGNLEIAETFDKKFWERRREKKVKERENLRRWVWSESDRENRSR